MILRRPLSTGVPRRAPGSWRGWTLVAVLFLCPGQVRPVAAEAQERTLTEARRLIDEGRYAQAETLARELFHAGWSADGHRESVKLDGHPVELQVEKL